MIKTLRKILRKRTEDEKFEENKYQGLLEIFQHFLESDGDSSFRKYRCPFQSSNHIGEPYCSASKLIKGADLEKDIREKCPYLGLEKTVIDVEPFGGHLRGIGRAIYEGRKPTSDEVNETNELRRIVDRQLSDILRDKGTINCDEGRKILEESGCPLSDQKITEHYPCSFQV